MLSKEEYLIGFHARSMEELLRVVSFKKVNLVELKPDYIQRRSRVSLYEYQDGKFTINHKVAEEIREICYRHYIAQIQLHVPFETKNDPSEEKGLCYANKEHHDTLIARFEMINELYEKYSIGAVAVVHPPAFRLEGKEVWSIDEAIAAGRKFFARLDALIKERRYKFKVGIENMVNPKKSGSSCIGYLPNQIDKLIGRTSEIGINIDSGHRLLAHEMSIARLFSYGDIVSMHFHTNSGEFDADSYDDDEHEFATEKNHVHYWRYIAGIRRRDTPVILEISRSQMKKLSDTEIGMYLTQLRNHIW
ncbi:MAG: hypothetical protein KAT43_02445 [Nanoarchaeota archaeon]|nr:hypothetical protein [Nanoarchaeota archaeon]